LRAALEILIVDDSLDDQDLYARLLRTMPACNYRCSFATDGRHALALIGKTQFDCVLVDYTLPGMNGLSLLQAIRQIENSIPVVMLTGQARDDLAAAILDAGANAYLDKAMIDGQHLHDAIAAAVEACANARQGSAQEKLRLLIIDDCADDREHYARLLKAGHYRSARVIEAPNGEAALALVRSEALEAILLDYGLPGMDGLEVLAQIRCLSPFVPVIFMTGHGNVTVAVKALQSGASDYLVKSMIDAEKLSRTIFDSVLKSAIAAKDAQILATTAALRASEERNRLLLDSLSEDAIIMLDPAGQVQSWNLTSQRIRGYTAEEIIGRNFSVFFLPEDRAAGLPARILDIVRETGRHATEGWRVRKDGSRMFASVVIDAIRDEAGELLGFGNVIRDITDLARERTALHLANERITLATDSGGIGIWDYDIASGEMVWDAWMYRLYGMAPQDGAGAYEVWQLHLHPDDREAAAQALRDSIEGRTPYNMVYRVVWDDGSVHHIRGSGHVTRNAAGEAVRMIGANWDVTESREFTARLAQQAERLAEARDAAETANHAKSRFLAGMSHELRTPLNGILGNARLLRLEGGLQPAQMARVDSMLSAGSHLLEMIHCVLDLSQIETERMTVQAEPVALRVLANACLDMVRNLAQEKGLALNLSVAADVPAQAVADPVRLRQVLLNMLGNAAKFTRRGGIDLRLRTTGCGASLRFDVADTGPGIPQEKQRSLFQDFMRLQSGDGRAAEGAGLGLALSSRLAALMGGRLGHAENPGGGSIFWLELPLLAYEAAEAPREGAGAAAPQDPSRKLCVLVVDDSEMNLDIAASFLHIMGHQVSCVGGGAEAVAKVAAEPFDVVFMDVQMPDMDGLEATRRIRALPGAAGQVPVIALSAQVFTDQLDACRQAGMSGHLGKPFTEAALYATLADYVPGAPPDRRSASLPAWGEVEADAPVIDLDVFRTNTRLLRPASVVSYLENIAASAGAVLSALRDWDGSAAIGVDVLQAAHKLAGNVGLFGFARAADAARRFERAARTGTPETRLLAESLAAALKLSIREADEQLAAVRG
jgi:PAS domain S-box-containing protein